jgi:hypothetical protein
MDILIITHFGEFIEALNINTNLEKWAYNWLVNSGKFNDIEFWESGEISCDLQNIVISADNGIINLDVQIKTI